MHTTHPIGRRGALCVAMLFVVAAGGLPFRAMAEPGPDAAAGWLDRARAEVPAMPDEDAAYTQLDLVWELMKARAALGQAQEAAALRPTMQTAVMRVNLLDGDAWATAFLPGAALLAGKPDEAATGVEGLAFAATTQLDGWQLLAEAADASGDDDRYAEATEKMLGLFPQVIVEGIAQAKEDGWPYDGTFSAWYAANLMRHRGDRANLRRLADVGLAEPTEWAGVLGALAQVQWTAGDAEAARDTQRRAASLIGEAVERMRATADDDTPYQPDLATSLPELVAAVWLLDGVEAALETGDEIARTAGEPKRSWLPAAGAHAAAALRRRGDPDAAAEAAGRAADALDPEAFADFIFETMWVARELAVSGKQDDAEALIGTSTDAGFRAMMQIGMAQGHLVASREAMP